MSRQPNSLDQALRSAVRRLWATRALNLFGWFSALWLGVVFVIAAARFLDGISPLTPHLTGILFLGLVVLAALAVILTVPDRMAAARALDRTNGTADRIATAVALKNGGAGSAMSDLALREIEAFVLRQNPTLQIDLPRSLILPVIAVCIIGLLATFHWAELNRSSTERASASVLLNDAADVIEPVPDEVGSELVENLQTAAREIQTNRALDANEETLRALARAAEALRSELAGAAASAIASQANGADGAAGRPTPSDSAPESDPTESGGSAADGSEDEILAEAAEQAEQRIQDASSAAGRSPFTSEQLAQMDRALDGLENLKARARGEKSSDQRDGSSPQEGSNQALAMSGDEGESGAPPESGDQQSEQPGGPGGGEDPNADGLPGNERPIAGATGPDEVTDLDDLAGVSVTASLISSDGAGRATAAYRDVYDLVEPEAAHAVRNENIPPGIRQTVRTYFESIRPTPSRDQ